MLSDSRKRFFVSGVCCSTEETLMRKKLDGLLGAGNYRFNSVTCELVADASVDEKSILKELRSCGFTAREKRQLEGEQSFWQRHQEAFYTSVAAILAAIGILASHVGENGEVSPLLLLAAITIGGWKIFLKAYRSVRGLVLDMNVLMSVAVFGALAIGKWEEAAAVIVLFAGSVMLESYSVQRTRKAIQSLMKLSPDKASVLVNGNETFVPATEVIPGTIVRIRPGERIPLDGLVTEGSSLVDESPITGEPDRVPKTGGATVFAGSINERGSLKVRVTRRFEDTTLARMVHLIQEAQHARAPVQSFVDRFARVYTPVVLVLALFVALGPPVFFGESFGDWLYRALVLLVIACPCALVISTPVTIVSALASAARHGTLIKGGTHIETLSKVRTVAFDKTGTLTQGKAKVTDVLPLNTLTRQRVLALVAAIEQHSEHHVADAILVQAEREAVRYDDIEVSNFAGIPGKGVGATIDGTRYFLGNDSLDVESGQSSIELRSQLQHLREEGKTVVVLVRDREPIGIVAVKDMAREQSRAAIEELRRGGIRTTIMLSGDHQTPAQQLAQELGIDEAQGDLLPEKKVSAIEDLKKMHGTVAMVGDGVNDAPALAASSVGIAMGVSGTDAALESADVVLTSDDLSRLPGLFRLSRKAMRVVKQNVAIALSLKLVFLVLSVAGVASLWMAVLADDGASLIVILNGLRLLSAKG